MREGKKSQNATQLRAEARLVSDVRDGVVTVKAGALEAGLMSRVRQLRG